ncbi:MAG: NAD/NADP octopine/nopaline dehydrogenase family protein [Armatimonadota bacterium]
MAQELRYDCFAVLGAGNGGLAMAAHLTLKGIHVRLWNRSPERLLPIQRSGYIQLVASAERDDLPHGQARVEVVTSDIAEAVADARVLMVVVPATGHAEVAERLAPHLRDGHIIVLNPGRTGGALEALHVLQQHGVKADVIVAEAQTLLYASRALNPGQVQIFGIKNSVPVAAIPAYRTPEVVKALSVAYTEFVPGDNVMKTSMENIGAIFHPAVTVLNAARIESTHGDFEYYIDGITPSAAQILEQIDAERVAVAAAMGFNCMTAREWLYIAYGASGKTLFEAIRANQGYYGIKAPPTVHHRYITEDVPMSLVPIASLGEMLGVPCPTIKAIIHLANLLHGCDYWQTGRTVESMGLAGLSLRELRLRILEGIPAEQR